LVLLTHTAPVAFRLAIESAGSSNPARMAMMAMTTSSSIRVNARRETGGMAVNALIGWAAGCCVVSPANAERPSWQFGTL